MTRKSLFLAALLVAAGTACSKDSTGPAPLAAPAGFTAQQQSLTSIRLSWSGVTGATYYLLERTSAATPGGRAAKASGAVAIRSSAAAALRSAARKRYGIPPSLL